MDDRYCDIYHHVPASERQVRKQVSAIDMVIEVNCELAGDDAQEIWTCNMNLNGMDSSPN